MQTPRGNTGRSPNDDKAVSAGAERNQAAHIANVAAGWERVRARGFGAQWRIMI